MNAKEITHKEFEKLVGAGSLKDFSFAGSKPAIVDFYAPWCSYCTALAPVFEELAGKYGQVADFYKADIEASPELESKFNIRTIPTLLFAQAGAEPVLMLGTMNRQQLEEKIKEIFKL